MGLVAKSCINKKRAKLTVRAVPPASVFVTLRNRQQTIQLGGVVRLV